MEAYTKHFCCLTWGHDTATEKITNVSSFRRREQSNCRDPTTRSVAEAEIFFGVVYRVSVLWVDGQGPVTHAHAHKQGFGPLEKITLIITGCIWTCPQRGGGGGGGGGDGG